MMGARSNLKGKRFERLVASLIGDRRGWTSSRTAPMQARVGVEHPDVLAQLQPTVGMSTDKELFAIECKAGQRISWMPAMEQAVACAKSEGASYAERRIPMVAAKVDRKPPVVMLRLSDFLDLIERLN